MERARPDLPRNELVRDYLPGSGERASLKAELCRMGADHPELPLVIGGKGVLTGWREAAIEPHHHRRTLAHAHLGGAAEVNTAITAARRAAAIDRASRALRYAAGNFYVNDKPTGAVVGQQPFGGARASGTNDKAGSVWNLIRWVSPRTLKTSHVSATSYRYPFMQVE